jgi:enoyl-CoA hydratase
MFHDLTRADAVELMRYGQRVFGAIEALPMPTIAAISGYALGGGLELALACDIRIATPTSILGQPEITLANLPGWGGTQRLPRAIGESAALDLILSGRRIDGVEALRLGLVTRLADDAIAAAYSLAAEIGAHAPKAARLAKQAIQKARYSAPDGYLFEREAVGQCFGTAEQLAALEKFRSRSAAERNGR